MNRNKDQFATSISLRVPDGVQDQPAATPRAYPAASAEPALFRLDLRRSLQLHRRLALGFVLCGLILAAGYLVRYWRTYTAQALVYIQPTPSAVLEGPAPMHWPYNYDPATYDSYVAQQMLSMQRPDVLIGALHKMDPGTFQQSGESDENAAERLKGAIEVKRVETSYQVAITAHAPNPDTAASMANAVAASYIEDTAHEQKAGDAERLSMLKDERDRVKKELDDDRAEQAALNAQLGVAAIGAAAPEHYDSDIAAIHDELVKARAEHDEFAARLTSMNSGAANSPAMDTEGETLVTTDPGLASLKGAQEQRRAVLVQQMANLTPNNPQYKQDEAELQKIDASLESSTQEMRAKAAARIEEQLRTDLDRTSGLEARLNVQLAEMTKAAAGATPKLQRSSDLASDIERLQARFTTVDEQLQNQSLEDNAPGTAHVAVAALAPLHPSDNGVIRNALVLFVLFALMGLAAAVIRQKMDPHVYVASDVEHLLGFAPMAQLPDFSEVPEEVADEHLLRLAAGIEYACKEGGIRTCVFTGTGPGAGVTTLATRVKDTLGLLGRNTVLVNASGSAPIAPQGDEDERRTARSTARVQPKTGTLESKIDATPEGLSQETIAQQALVLTDAAPLTVSAEAEYLARCADCTFLVIESGVTTRQQLRTAAASLQRLNPAAVGLVLNRVGMAKADPAFRRSVNDVATHLRNQNRRATRPTVRNLHVAESQKSIAEPTAAATQKPSAGEFAFVVAAGKFERSAAYERSAEERAAADRAVSDRSTVAPAEQTVVAPVERAPVPPMSLPQPALQAPAIRRNAQPIQKPVPAPDVQSLPKPALVAPELLRRIKSRSKLITVPAAEPVPQPDRAPTAPELPRDVEPISKLVTGGAPEPEPPAKPAAPMAAIWREDQPAAKPAAKPEAETVIIVKTEPIAPPAPQKAELVTKPAWIAAAKPAAETRLPVQPAPQSAPPPEPPQAEEVPWWLMETPFRSDASIMTIPVRQRGGWYSDSSQSIGLEPAAAEEQQVATEERVEETLPHLGRLRGILFSLGIKEFGPAKDSATNGKNGSAHVEPAPGPESDSALDHPVPLGAFATPPEPAPELAPEPVQAAVEDSPTRTFVPRWVTAEPEFLPPKVETPENGKESSRNNSASASHERGETFDEVEILPSRRGQYRR